MVRITLRVSPLIDISEMLYGSYYIESFPPARKLRCYMVRITLRVSLLIDNTEMLYGSYYIESFPTDRQL